MTLEEGLGDTASEAEAGIGLVGASIVQVGRDRIGNECAHPLCNFVTSLQPRPDRDVPRGGKTAAWAARFHPFLDCARQFRVAAQGDRVARVEGKIRRDVMALSASLPILNPLLQITRTTDLVWWKPLEGGFQLAAEIL